MIRLTERTKRPETIVQFGEGNFLRAFVDDMIDELNKKELYDGGVVIVQPLPTGLINVLNEQDGLYTLLLRGLKDGKPVTREKIVTCVTRGINPYADYDSLLALARSSRLRFAVSNTTEAGIAYRPGETLSDQPPVSFPGKVTAFLYERFRAFDGDPEKGLVFIPCELIDDNGEELRRIVMRVAREWELGEAFVSWIKNACVFTSTLVDRIVTGFPRGEAPEMYTRLGYEDKLLDTGEIFHFWVIEGPEWIAEELPFAKAELNVVFTDDVRPYKKRKVRILNGAHTSLVPVALLCGKETVGESVADDTLHAFLEQVLYAEVIPTLDLPREDLLYFAGAVFDRFANPFIRHRLLDIALNTTSKWRARVLPSVEGYLEQYGKPPKALIFSFAATLEMFDRFGLVIKDTDDIGELWDELKQKISGFEQAVNAYRSAINADGCETALRSLLDEDD